MSKKPCPWCGREDQLEVKKHLRTEDDLPILEREWAVYIGCRNCHATGPFVQEDGDVKVAELSAWRRWNERANV